MKARSTGTLRRLRSLLVHQVRSSRFFPTTIPDRLGDDDVLAGGRLDERVIVYFPDTAESLYQLQPWLPALEALHQRFPVVVICQDSRTAAAIRRTSRLRVLTVARYGRLDDLLSRSEVAVVLYVNHSSRNFECLRFTEVVHVYLGHGDSDKGVSASNQVKAYDYCFVAGEVAVARIAAHVRRFDAALPWLGDHPHLDAAIEPYENEVGGALRTPPGRPGGPADPGEGALRAHLGRGTTLGRLLISAHAWTPTGLVLDCGGLRGHLPAAPAFRCHLGRVCRG